MALSNHRYSCSKYKSDFIITYPLIWEGENGEQERLFRMCSYILLSCTEGVYRRILLDQCLGVKIRICLPFFFNRIYLLWAPKSYGQRRLHCCSARIKAAFLKLWELEWSLYVQYPVFHVISLLYSTMKNMHFQQGQLLIHCMQHTGNCAHMPSASGGIW